MIVSYYTAGLALLLLFLSVRVLVLRRRLGVAILDGDIPVLARAVRAQGNFCEYVPMGVFLIFCVETQGGQAWWLHALGIALSAGRVLHALGISRTS